MVTMCSGLQGPAYKKNSPFARTRFTRCICVWAIMISSLARSERPEAALEYSTVDFATPARAPLGQRMKRADAVGMVMPDQRKPTGQRAMAHALNQGPRSAAQRKQLQEAFGDTVQLEVDTGEFAEEKLLKARFSAAQRVASRNIQSRNSELK
jgi:hypothetical protein